MLFPAMREAIAHTQGASHAHCSAAAPPPGVPRTCPARRIGAHLRGTGGAQVSRMPIIYEVNIFLTNRFVPIPEVDRSERLLVEQLGVSGFYHVIARCAPAGSPS